jgi:hypothetical protein
MAPELYSITIKANPIIVLNFFLKLVDEKFFNTLFY